MTTQTTPPAPVLVFGFDAGDPDWLLEWALDGTMPNLASILKRGGYARFSGPEMISEHGMWVGLTSGVSRARHGYYYHRQVVPGTYDLLPARGRLLSVRPFWSQLQASRLAIIDVPDIAAPEPALGIQISEWATHYPYYPAATHPPELLAEITTDFGPRPLIEEKPGADEATDLRIFSALMARIEKKTQLCLRYLATGRFDLAFIVFGESHTGAHQFWHYHKAKAGPLAHAIRDIYRAIDWALGALLEVFPKNGQLFVVSSVGIKEQWPAAGLNEAFCRQLGYQIRPSPRGDSRMRPIDLLRRMLPQAVRDQLSRLVSPEKRDALLSDKFRMATDWSRTSLFCIPSYYTGQFRVNLRGREPAGIVEPGRDYAELLDRVEKDLLALRDPMTGRPAIKAVRKTAEMFGGDPPGSLPDIFAEWADAGHFMEEIHHPKAVLRQTPCEFHRSTDHSQFGFLAAAGPCITARGKLPDVSPLDLAPTVASHLSSPGVAGLDGQPIPGMSVIKNPL
jgi:predicted AlkP superfamily phosphohydrolase/phosphomutase